MSQRISDKPVVRYILEHCYARGIKHVVLSPGSRNAPFILSFPASEYFKCLILVDERSAAYFALGLALKTREPVVLVCTSGTAALNYAPAIAEAYYQQIPLIVITADRPPELIDQADGQTIRQSGMYQNFIRYACQTPSGVLTAAETGHLNRMLNEAFLQALGTSPGPVHINVPFREPLYGRTNFTNDFKIPLLPLPAIMSIDSGQTDILKNELKSYKRILLVLGAFNGKDGYEWQKVALILAQKGVVVLAESLSNIHGEPLILNVDRVVTAIDEDMAGQFCPDLLITADVPVLSKMLKKFLRNCAPGAHWHFSNKSILIDTYGCLTRQIEGPALKILSNIAREMEDLNGSFPEQWQQLSKLTRKLHSQFMDGLPWSDMKVFHYLASAVPAHQEVHLSNSTPVRYAQLFSWKESQTFYANRGTSGIDGCVSTSAGAAFAGSKPVTLITGDLAFFYDANGLWHRYLPDSFRIVVINNGGGGIFRVISGPSETEELEPFFEVRDHRDCQGIALTFGLEYFSARDESELNDVLTHFWGDKGKPAVLEIFTPTEVNGEILKSYFKALRIEQTTRPFQI